MVIFFNSSYYQDLRTSKAQLEREFDRITVALEEQARGTAGKTLKSLKESRIQFVNLSLDFWLAATHYHYVQFNKVAEGIMEYACHKTGNGRRLHSKSPLIINKVMTN